MSSVIAELEYEHLIDFQAYGSQQFATVNFDRNEDSETCLITIFKDGKIIQKDGNNKFNPSRRRHSSCVYVEQEWPGGNRIKICTIQHKGETLIEIHSVSEEEYLYLFGDENHK